MLFMMNALMLFWVSQRLFELGTRQYYCKYPSGSDSLKAVAVLVTQCHGSLDNNCFSTSLATFFDAHVTVTFNAIFNLKFLIGFKRCIICTSSMHAILILFALIDTKIYTHYLCLQQCYFESSLYFVSSAVFCLFQLIYLLIGPNESLLYFRYSQCIHSSLWHG